MSEIITDNSKVNENLLAENAELREAVIRAVDYLSDCWKVEPLQNKVIYQLNEIQDLIEKLEIVVRLRKAHND